MTESFPVDPETLSLLGLCFEPGGPKMSGVLDLLSGYDPAVGTDVGGGVVECGQVLWTRDDVIRSLIAEVVRLRAAERSNT